MKTSNELFFGVLLFTIFQINLSSGQQDCESLTTELQSGSTDQSQTIIGATEDTIDQICRTVRERVEKLAEYSRRCVSLSTIREQLNVIVVGITKVSDKACNDKEYQKRLFTHGPCISKLKDIKKCEEGLTTFDQNIWSYSDIKKEFCRVRDDTYSCIQNRSISECGEAAARFILVDINLILEGDKPKELCPSSVFTRVSGTNSEIIKFSVTTTTIESFTFNSVFVTEFPILKITITESPKSKFSDIESAKLSGASQVTTASVFLIVMCVSSLFIQK